MSKYIIQKAIDRKDLSDKAARSMAHIEYEVQPKYDGCHMVVLLEGGVCVATLSATGEEVLSCSHIARQVEIEYGHLGRIAVCGEVWHPTLDFPSISGAFRRHCQQDHLQFAPFDLVTWCVSSTEPELADQRPYSERSAPLRSRQTTKFLPALVLPLVAYPADGVEAPLPSEYAASLKKRGGYDGATLHDLNAPYIVGRCRKAEVVKIKPLIELDLLVVEVVKDVGEKTGRGTAALVVRLKDGITCKVATGLSEAEQADPEQFLGKIVAVEAMGWTADGKLREPRVKGLRTDKTQPDY